MPDGSISMFGVNVTQLVPEFVNFVSVVVHESGEPGTVFHRRLRNCTLSAMASYSRRGRESSWLY